MPQRTDPEIWLRLVLAVIAAALLGLNRGAHGHAPNDSRTFRLAFALNWKRPERSGPPLDLLKIVNEHFGRI
jgi:hypothetical protein